MNELDVINAYVRELKLEPSGRMPNRMHRMQFGSSGDVWAISDDCLKRKWQGGVKKAGLHASIRPDSHR